MKIHAIALAGVAALALAGPASAGERWYVGFGVGESWADAKLSGSGEVCGAACAIVNSSGDLDIRQSPDVELYAGYKWADSGMMGSGFRLEGEAGYRQFSVGAWHPGGGVFLDPTHTSGHLSVVSSFINALWDWSISPKWAVTLGGGIGIANVDPEIHNKELTRPPATGATDRLAFKDDSAFTWQLIGGLTYSVEPNIDLQLDYRWQQIGDTSHRSDTAFLQRARIEDFDTQTVKLSLRWYYCPPEAPPPPPPPPVETPKPPMVFIVYFEFDKYRLTEDAQRVVADAVKAVKDGNYVHVMVTGHTDTTGSHEYNQVLSEQRASSVKTEMIRLGMTEDQIGTQGKSFDDLAKPTGPGVRNQENRRAVIDLGK